MRAPTASRQCAAFANIEESSSSGCSTKIPNIDPQGPDLAVSVLSTHPRSLLLESCRQVLVDRTIG